MANSDIVAMITDALSKEHTLDVEVTAREVTYTDSTSGAKIILPYWMFDRVRSQSNEQ